MADAAQHGVLQELSAACFPELVEILKKDIPRSLVILGCLQQMDRSLKIMNGHVYVSRWPNPDIVALENTAYRALVQWKLSPAIIYASCSTEKLKMTLEQSHFRQLFTGTSTTKIIGDPRCTEIAYEISQLNSCEVKVAAASYLCALTEPANLVKWECPASYYIAPLKIQHAPLVDKVWKFGGQPRGVERMENLISHSLAAGVYCQDTHELVTWALLSEYGAIGFLHTLEPHRRRGLAKAIIYHLAKTLLSQGKAVFSVIEEENENSRQLFCKLGFTIFSDDFVAFLHILAK